VSKSSKLYRERFGM